MAAAILWRGNCDLLPSRYFYDETDQFPGQFDTDDLHYRLGNHSSAVEAVQLRPGYRITLFEKQGWAGKKEVIYGAFEDGESGIKEQRLKC